jgi:hypothetical protein
VAGTVGCGKGQKAKGKIERRQTFVRLTAAARPSTRMRGQDESVRGETCRTMRTLGLCGEMTLAALFADLPRQVSVANIVSQQIRKI